MISSLFTGAIALTSSTSTIVLHRYVVTIGYNTSANPAQSDLKHADDDAARFFELLADGAHRSYLLVRFDDDSAETFSNVVDRVRPPTKAALEEVMSAIRRDLERDAAIEIRTELYFFYAGHGDEEEGVGYVNLADGRLTRPEFIKLVLEGRRAGETHVIFDACKSYFMVAGRGPGGKRAPRLVPFAGPTLIDGVGFVLSTSNDAESHEWSALTGGIFSHEVRSGLLGAADSDGDGWVQYAELEAFVAVANAGIPFPKFRPNVFIRPPPGRTRPAIMDLSRHRGTWLVIDEDEAGRVSIRDHRGLRYADAHKAPAGRLELHLSNALRYDIEWNDRLLSITPRGGRVRIAEVEPALNEVAARSQIHEAFEHLFSAPFSADLVAGYQLGASRIEPEEVMVVASDVDPFTTSMLITGGGLTLASAVLAGFAVAARNQIDGAPQIDRDALIDRSQGLTIAAGVTAGLGVTALALGIFGYLDE